MVAAGSVVSQSVPPLTMVQGNPAKRVAQCGIPLVGNTYEQFMRNLKPIKDRAIEKWYGTVAEPLAQRGVNT